jgi:hypothetical protein
MVSKLLHIQMLSVVKFLAKRQQQMDTFQLCYTSAVLNPISVVLKYSRQKLMFLIPSFPCILFFVEYFVRHSSIPNAPVSPVVSLLKYLIVFDKIGLVLPSLPFLSYLFAFVAGLFCTSIPRLSIDIGSTLVAH